MTDESPFITKKNVYLGDGWNNYWRMENDGVNNYSFRHLYTNEDPQYIVFNTGTWTGNGSDPTTAAGNVWACGSQQLDAYHSYHFRFVTNSDVTPPAPEFSVGNHALQLNNGQYLAMGADGLATLSNTAYTWYVSASDNGGYRLSPASDHSQFLQVAWNQELCLVGEATAETVIYPTVNGLTSFVLVSSTVNDYHNPVILCMNNGVLTVSGGSAYMDWTLI